MKVVLHVYENDAARRILDNCRRVTTPQDRLLIIETILPDQVDPADASHERAIMSDINMLAVTGGKERTLSEWQHLLAAARRQLGRTTMVANSRHHGLLEAIPA